MLTDTITFLWVPETGQSSHYDLFCAIKNRNVHKWHSKLTLKCQKVEEQGLLIDTVNTHPFTHIHSYPLYVQFNTRLTLTTTVLFTVIWHQFYTQQKQTSLGSVEILIRDSWNCELILGNSKNWYQKQSMLISLLDNFFILIHLQLLLKHGWMVLTLCSCHLHLHLSWLKLQPLVFFWETGTLMHNAKINQNYESKIHVIKRNSLMLHYNYSSELSWNHEF